MLFRSSDWFLVGKVVPAPGAPTGTVGTAGSMGNGTYYYVITALDALGETIAGTQSAGKVVTGPSGSVVLAWAAVPEAVSYKVYRTTTSGVYTTPCYLGNPTAATYTDTALNASAGAPPAARTYEDNLPVEELGAQLLFDHALPPQGGKLVWHKDTLFLAAPSATSASYGTPETTNLSNVLFHSRLGEPFYWPGQSYFQIGNDEALLSPVSWGEYLFCWKANGFWALRGYDTSTWALEQITDRLGMVAANRAAAGPPGVLWADRRGLYLYDGTQIRLVLDLRLADVTEPSTATILPCLAYHLGEFYYRDAETRTTVAWDPLRDSWRRTDKWCEIGMVPVALGADQTHLLCLMDWATGGSPELTAWETGGLTNCDAQGTVATYDDRWGWWALTFPPLEAPPGYEIVPLAVYLEGTWAALNTVVNPDLDVKPTVYLSPEGDYSSTAGDNAWAATPTLAVADYVVGVPSGYTYSSAPVLTKANASPTWYLQVRGTYGAGLEIRRARLEFYLRTRGET